MHRAAKWIARACGCFEAGTQVLTSRGLVAIDQLCVGDEVFVQDEVTGEVSLRRVVQTFVRKAAPIVAVTLLGTATPAIGDEGEGLHQADSGLVTLNTTEEHPFLVEVDGTAGVRGYTPGRWVQAASLRPGDAVRTKSGDPAVVISVRFTGRRVTVYNIEVEGLHNYRVGRDGVVVHNSDGPCRTVKHHWIPQQKDIKAWAMRAGLDVDDFIQGIPEDMHKWIHGNHRRPQDYNFVWQQFRVANPHATREEILAFKDSTMAHYRSEWLRSQQP